MAAKGPLAQSSSAASISEDLICLSAGLSCAAGGKGTPLSITGLGDLDPGLDQLGEGGGTSPLECGEPGFDDAGDESDPSRIFPDSGFSEKGGGVAVGTGGVVV